MKEGWDAPLSDWTEEIKLYTNKEVKRMATEAISKIKARTPSLSGKLRAAWYMEQMIEEGLLSITIINKVEYGIFVEYGTHRVAGRYMMEQTFNELVEGVI